MLNHRASFTSRGSSGKRRRPLRDDKKRADITQKVATVAVDTLGKPYQLGSSRLNSINAALLLRVACVV